MTLADLDRLEDCKHADAATYPIVVNDIERPSQWCRSCGALRMMLYNHPTDAMKLVWGEWDVPTQLIAAARENEKLKKSIARDMSVCVCGCPVEDHDVYDEGESCEDESHECLRTCPAIQQMFASLRAQVQAAERAVEAIRNQHGINADGPGTCLMCNAVAAYDAQYPRGK